MKKRGVYTIPPYPGWSNQQLTKNTGLVPYLLHKNYGFHAVMAGSKVESAYPNAEYINGVDLVFFQDDFLGSRLEFIRENAEDMDLFILHGPDSNYVPMIRCYREVRPDGKIYLELDPNSYWMDRIQWDTEDFRYMLSQCNVIGSSGRKMQSILSRKWPCKIEYLPNGFYNYTNIDMTVDVNKKENIILTVGRIGTRQKCNELLLEAFSLIYHKIPSWHVRLVGSITPEFENYLHRYFIRFPSLKHRVTATGAIQDRQVLMNEYRQAKIFALTSLYEGGPNVIAEALYMGNYIITSDIDASIDATDGEKCGSVFHEFDAHELAEKLLEVCGAPDLLEQAAHYSVKYAEDVFNSEKIVDYLYYLLYGASEDVK